VSDVLVKVDNVSKKFCRGLKRSLWYGMQDLGSELIGRDHGNNGRLRQDEFWAINNVSFELTRGKCLGLIGRNGAGKSTLLKILHGLIKPDEGRIEMRGRVGALIELGSGFNPVLSGRENIYINASVLGFKKKEIDDLFDQIVEFSELEEFIDTPLMYYSSGMKVRLGFSVAIHMNPDVLILDEVLAVGDTGFRMKSLNKMTEMMSRAAVIFVSHSMSTIARTCNSILLLNEGNTVFSGRNVLKGIEQYYDLYEVGGAFIEYNEKAQIHNLNVKSAQNPVSDDKGRSIINYLDDLVIEIDLSVDRSFDDFYLVLPFYKDLQLVAKFQTSFLQKPFINNRDVHSIKITIPKVLFSNGEYFISVFIHSNIGYMSIPERLAVYRNYASIKVEGLDFADALVAPLFLQGEVKY